MGKRGKQPGVGSVSGEKPGDTSKSFLTWLSANGVQHPRCTIGYLPGTGRGVVATKPIKAGDQVVEVPDDAVCMAENCCIAEQLEDAGLAKATAVDPMQEVQGLILAVMAERYKAKASRWREYLDFIPQDMTHMPMFWKEEELRELRGTAALDKMEGKVQVPADAPTQVQLAWEDVAKPFIEKHRDLKVFPQGEAACWDLYRWATAAVASYSFILGDDHYQAMVPFWDALNHITGKANIRLSHQEKRGRGGVLQMIATRDIAVGEEVVNNYGELSQAELLRAYGFVETHPEAEAHAHVQVPLRFVVQAAQAEAARLQRQAAPPSAHQAPQEMVTTNGEDVRCTSRGGATAEQCKGGRGDGGGDGESEDDGSDRSEGGLSEFGLGGSEGEEEGCDLLEEAASRGARSGGLGASACMSGEAGASEPRCDRPKGGGTCERPSEIGGADTVQQGKGASQEQPQGKAIRGLGARLRMCACYGLMPRSGVFKVFDPAASDGTPKAGRPFPPPELTEVVRALLLPLHEVRALQRRAASWRPCTKAQGLTKDSTTKHGSQTVIETGPVNDELAAAVQAVMCRVVVRMQGRFTSSLGDDEQLLQRSLVTQCASAGGEGEEEREGQEQQQGISNQEEGAAGGRKKRRGEEKEQAGTKRRKGAERGMQQPEQQQQQGQQEELPPRLMAALVARIGEKRCLARLHEWWGCGAGSCGSSTPVQLQQQQQQRIFKCVHDHVAAVWGVPRPGMHGVRREGSDDEDDDSEEEDEESDSSGSSSCDDGEESGGDEGRDGQGTGGKARGGKGSVAENSKEQHAEEGKAGGRKRSSAGPAAKGGEAQVAATLSRPNLQQKQHFSFDFAL